MYTGQSSSLYVHRSHTLHTLTPYIHHGLPLFPPSPPEPHYGFPFEAIMTYRSFPKSLGHHFSSPEKLASIMASSGKLYL